MAESKNKIDSNNPSMNDQSIIKLNKIHFTNAQIENLLKLQSFVNVEPQDCVTLVSSTLKLEDIELNNIHFWLADTLAAVVKNIQLTHMSVLQGTIVVRWILCYMSLAVGEDKLSKIELFENLRKCIKFGLANAEEFMIPLPNTTECPKYVAVSHQSRSKFKKSDYKKPVTAARIAVFILNTLREIFWDDFKYTVIQMAFEVDSIEVIEKEYFIRYVEPLYQTNDDGKNEKNTTKEKSYECRSAAILNRYFFRNFNLDPSLSFITDIGVQRTFYPAPARGFDTLDNAILPLSAANLTKNAEKYIEKLRIENLQKRRGSSWNTRVAARRARSVYKKF